MSFGTPATEPGDDEGAIREGRRQLLLTVASAPESTRKYVETVASSEGVPLDALYGMLKVLGVDTASGEQDLEKQLLDGARQLKTFMEHQPGGVKRDDELVRLSALADQAQAEGAMQLALKFREDATKRARQLSGERDQLEDQLKQDRLEIAATYAENAETAALNFEFDTAAQLFDEAYREVARWDDLRALQYKWDAGQALKNFGDMKGDNAALEAAVETYHEALLLAPRETRPDDWAALQNNLGNAYEALSARRGDAALLSSAVAAYQAALEVYRPETVPLDWAMTQNNLGVALIDASAGTTGTVELDAAVDAFNRALQYRTREAVPIDWATTQNNLGIALKAIGERTGDPDKFLASARAYHSILDIFARDTAPLDWAMTQNNLGTALSALGRVEPESGGLEASVAAYTAALEEYRPERSPLDWAMTQNNLGFTHWLLAHRDGDRAESDAAIAAYRAALTQYTRERTPHQWAMTLTNLSLALTENLSYPPTAPDEAEKVREAVDNYRAALEIYLPTCRPRTG